MTYHHSRAALGLSEAGTQTTLSRGTEVEQLQRRLIAAGDLSPTITDGVISSNNSPTLQATKASAQAMGLSASLVTRTSSGGITLPTQLYRAIMGTGPDVVSSLLRPGSPTDEVFSKQAPSVNDIVKMDRIAAEEAAATRGGSSTGVWVATAVGLVAVGGLAWMAMSRSKRSIPRTRASSRTTQTTQVSFPPNMGDTLVDNHRRRRR